MLLLKFKNQWIKYFKTNFMDYYFHERKLLIVMSSSEDYRGVIYDFTARS